MWKMFLALTTKNSRLCSTIFIVVIVMTAYYLISCNFIHGNCNASSGVTDIIFKSKHTSLIENDHEQNNADVTERHGDEIFKSMYNKSKVKKVGYDQSENEHVDKDSRAENSDSVSNTPAGRGRLLKLTGNTPADIIDIMSQPPIRFDPNYRNPCFMGTETNPLFKDGQLHCLPYFYLIGVKKSGTSDLFQRISAHPEFRDPGFKEAQWFPRVRCGISTKPIEKRKPFRDSRRKGIDNRSIKFYISMFDDAAASIQQCLSEDEEGRIYHNCVTAEATPANLHMHTGWKLLPGNEGLTEPRYTNFHYIKHITPGAKIIIIFRDPVTRLFSDFLHEMKIRGAQHTPSAKVAEKFHKQTSALMSAYRNCFNLYSMRRCIYNETLSRQLQKDGGILTDSFRAGFYAFYMQELLSVFSREQILTIHMAQYLTRAKQTLTDTFKYLNMSPLSSNEMSEILNLKAANTAKSNATMNSETKDMLYKFYRPYNEKMASLMEDSTYLFPQS